METLSEKSIAYLQMLCKRITDRSVGSEGNRAATAFFNDLITSLGWQTEIQEFDATDWIDGGASLHCGSDSFQVFQSIFPRLNQRDLLVSRLMSKSKHQRILLLHGEIAKEQIMLNFCSIGRTSAHHFTA
jgi:aminopeptidase YwaD